MRKDLYKVIVERPRSWKGGDAHERTMLLRLDELWFEVTLAELPVSPQVVTLVNAHRPTKVIVARRYDTVLRRETSRDDADSSERKRLYGACDLYALSKRQLSKREMKTHGLRE